jgi:hypothetical protein
VAAEADAHVIVVSAYVPGEERGVAVGSGERKELHGHDAARAALTATVPWPDRSVPEPDAGTDPWVADISPRRAADAVQRAATPSNASRAVRTCSMCDSDQSFSAPRTGTSVRPSEVSA